MTTRWDVEPAPVALRDMAELDAHDEIDALKTERNAAVAEAKMWLRRVLCLQQERDQARKELYESDKCLGEWQQSYDDLLRDFRRLELKTSHLQDDVDNANFLLRHLDPFLPHWLQNKEQRAANEMLYENLKDSRRDIL